MAKKKETKEVKKPMKSKFGRNPSEKSKESKVMKLKNALASGEVRKSKPKKSSWMFWKK